MSAVPLPKKSDNKKSSSAQDASSSSSTLWPTTTARPSSPTPSGSSNLQRNVEQILDPSSEPLATKCDVSHHTRVHSERSVCCKDLVDEDQRTLVDPDVVRDVIIGLSDGLTVPFALTAGELFRPCLVRAEKGRKARKQEKRGRRGWKRRD
jgi:hypothetical protein